MIRFLLAIIILSTAAKFIHTYGGSAWGYEIAKPLLQGEESQKEKCENEKNKFDHGDTLYFAAIKASGIFAMFVSSPMNTHSPGFYASLFRQPNTPPPNLPAI